MGKRSFKRAARAGAAVAVVGEVAERAKRAVRSSGSAVAAAGTSTGRTAKRIAQSSGSAVAASGASTGRAAKQFGKRVGGEVAATVRTAASNEDAVWTTDQTNDGGADAGPPSQDDPVATLKKEAARAQQAKMAAVGAAFRSGVAVPEIARSVGERRSTIKQWLTDGEFKPRM